MNTDDGEAAATSAVGLEPFVSELARSWSRETPEHNERELDGTLVFADISGFTRLTERLAARGRFGAEEMSDHLDLVLSELLTVAYNRGGWLVKWGGDALLLMFDGPDHVRRACVASAELQARMRDVGRLEASVGRVRLRMSIGIHTGTFSFYFLGQHHRELLISGAAATTTATLEATAEAGEILVSPQVASQLPQHCIGATKEPGVLLAAAPDCDAFDVAQIIPPMDVTGLVPELVLDHLVRGGGAGEHRQVTVAFLEFSGMVKLRAEHGAAAAAEALRGLVESVQESCHRYTVSFHETDISPDGGKIMLVAGAPIGVEDSAEAMLCALRQVLDEPGVLGLRAGVTSGRAFAGAVGPSRRRSYSVKGDVVNLAARIMGKCPVGEIWALPVVVETSRTQFALHDVPRFSVKGKKAQVLVRSVGPALARVETNRDLPLVGRVEEMAVLTAALKQAQLGAGSHIDLTGAPGIGKTRLLTELTDIAGDMRVLSGAGEPFRASSSYQLVRPLLLDALDLEAVATAELPAAISQWVAARAPHHLEWLPLLNPVLGTTMTDTARTRDIAPEFRAERLLILVADLVRIALPQPTLLIVDDMQFADEASADLLRGIARNIGHFPCLIVLAGRTDSDPADTADAGSASRQLVIGPMSAAESLVLITADTDNSPLSPHVAAAAVGRGGGNPLFTRQLAVAAQSVDDAAELPNTIEAVVATRIDRLRPAARQVLRAVAVAGMWVELSLLEDILADEQTSAAAVLGELDEFIAVDGTELRFRQAAIRETAYEGLAFRRRAELHGRLATLLAARYPDDTSAIDAVLSIHYFHAGDNPKALRCAKTAADRAAAAYANAEAAVLYRRAIAANMRLTERDPIGRAELLEHLGDVLARLGENEASDRCYLAVGRLRRGDNVALARIGLKRARSADRRGSYLLALGRLRRVGRCVADLAGADAAQIRLEMHGRAGSAQFGQGRLAAAHASCLRVVESPDADQCPEILADALALLDVIEINLGAGGDAQRADQALRLHEKTGDLAGQARVHTQIGYRAYLDGRWNDAVREYERARALVERLGDPANVALTNANLAEILLNQGRLPEAEDALREAIRVWRAAGSDNDVAFGRALLGRVLGRRGQYDAADELLRQAREAYVAEGAEADVVEADVYRAELLMLRGRPTQALELAAATLIAAHRLSDQPVHGPLLHRIIGASHDLLDRTAAADEAFDHALELAQLRGADHEVAFTVAAMVGRVHADAKQVNPGLVAETIPLQRRLGLVVDLTAVERAVDTPIQRSSDRSAQRITS